MALVSLFLLIHLEKLQLLEKYCCYRMKKQEHSFRILKNFSLDTRQSVKRRIMTERSTEIRSQM